MLKIRAYLFCNWNNSLSCIRIRFCSTIESLHHVFKCMFPEINEVFIIFLKCFLIRTSTRKQFHDSKSRKMQIFIDNTAHQKQDLLCMYAYILWQYFVTSRLYNWCSTCTNLPHWVCVLFRPYYQRFKRFDR
jgi:hypothetical protein